MRLSLIPLTILLALGLSGCGEKHDAEGEAAHSEEAVAGPVDTAAVDAAAALEAAAAAEPVAVEAGSAAPASTSASVASSVEAHPAPAEHH